MREEKCDCCIDKTIRGTNDLLIRPGEDLKPKPFLSSSKQIFIEELELLPVVRMAWFNESKIILGDLKADEAISFPKDNQATLLRVHFLECFQFCSCSLPSEVSRALWMAAIQSGLTDSMLHSDLLSSGSIWQIWISSS
jgi:hypothetical protein